MIPMGRLSTVPVPAPFQSPDDIEPGNELTDYELGGIALNDPSQGLRVHHWTLEANGKTGNVYVRAPGVPDTLLFTAPGITEASLAFDQNMRPFVAYVQSGQPRFYWYDTVLGATRVTDLAADARNPRCCLDDKRDYQTFLGSNDIILAYLRGSNLYYRQQRDRYEVEYLLKENIQGSRLLRVGMHQGWRLQFVLE